MSFHKEINDLPIEILCFILEFLPSKKLNDLKIVNKRWQDCINQALSKRITKLKRQKFKIEKLSFSNFIKIQKLDKSFAISNSTLYVPGSIQKDNLNLFKKWLLIFPNIKSMNLNGNFSYGNFYLLSLTHLLPKLEEVSFKSTTQQKDKELFAFLNSCENLKTLKWKGFFTTKMNNPMIINVLRKINYLVINFYNFVNLENSLENLVELTIKETPNDRKYWNFWEVPRYDRFRQMDQITFPNLKKLYITLVRQTPHLIRKLKFPQLEFAYLRSPTGVFVDQTFVNQIKNIKALHFKRILFSEGNLNSLENLIELKSFDLDFILAYNDKISDEMIEHKTLQEFELLDPDSCKKHVKRFVKRNKIKLKGFNWKVCFGEEIKLRLEKRTKQDEEENVDEENVEDSDENSYEFDEEFHYEIW